VNIHKNARLTLRQREDLVRDLLQGGLSRQAVAAKYRVSVRTVAKWVARFRAQEQLGLQDRSSRPHVSPRAVSPEKITAVLALASLRLTFDRIASEVGVSRASVCRILARHGTPKPVPLPRRYEHAAAGDLIHLDVKKLGRIVRVGHRITGDRRDSVDGAGWEAVFVAVDDHSRLAHARIAAREDSKAAVAFLFACVRFYKAHGVTVRRLLTDNGSAFRSKRFRKACRRLGLKHRFTKPYTPRTNGKAERFIQSSLREWAYAHVYAHSGERAAALPRWLHHYNWHRPHRGIGGAPPVSRLGLGVNNLLQLHS
jgi:transposase